MSTAIRRIGHTLSQVEDIMLQSLLSLAFIGRFATPRGTIPGLANWRRVRARHLRLV